MTGTVFDCLPYDRLHRFELFGGECIEIPSPTPEHQRIVCNLLFSLDRYLDSQNIGAVYASIEYVFGENTRLRPDLSIILGDDWRNLDVNRIPVPRPPAIAIEVLSPSERTRYSTDKADIYLPQVREVWQLITEERAILIHNSAELAILGEDDELRSPLLPGWSFFVKQVFDARKAATH